MRFAVALAALLLCASACGRKPDKVQGIPTYSVTRAWIESHCPSNAVPNDERVFVGRDTAPQFASIAGYRQGINLREIIDETPFGNTTVTLYVMRVTSDAGEIGEFVTLKPSENSDFEVKPLDVIWIWVFNGVPFSQ